MSSTFTYAELDIARKVWKEANPDVAFPKSNLTIILVMRLMGWY